VLIVVSLAALAEEAPTEPVASRSQADCSGFIAGSAVARDTYVVGGTDDDFHLPLRQFTRGQFVFLRSRRVAGVAVGEEFALVRPAKELFRTAWYPGQHWSMHTLGHVYQDVGRVKVTRVTLEGGVAEVTFACGPVFRGDIAMPYQARAIPEYAPSKEFDRFAPPNGKKLGAITAAMDDGALLAAGSMAYVNLGASDGVRVGQRFRIFRIDREGQRGLFAFPPTLRESLGEMVIISTYERSSVGIVLNSLRDISLGDGIEAE
jgi:hypothetical protein